MRRSAALLVSLTLCLQGQAEDSGCAQQAASKGLTEKEKARFREECMRGAKPPQMAPAARDKPPDVRARREREISRERPARGDSSAPALPPKM